MNMKRIITTILAASMMLIGTSAFAQASVGLGFANSPVKMSLLGFSQTYSLNGLYVGGSYNIALGSSGLGVAPGLYYTFLTKDKVADFEGYASGSFSEHYISVPVMLNFGFELAEDIVGRIYAGPTLAYGIASDFKYGSDVKDLPISASFSVYDALPYDRFDLMLGGGIAVDFYDMVRFDVGYDYGMLNRYDGVGSSLLKINRSQIHAGVSYLF